MPESGPKMLLTVYAVITKNIIFILIIMTVVVAFSPYFIHFFYSRNCVLISAYIYLFE